MYAIKASTRSCNACVRRASRINVPLRTPVYSDAVSARRNVRARAERARARERTADYGNQFQDTLRRAVEFVRTTWEDTADAEKPAIIAIIAMVVVAQIGIGATMDAVDRMPFFSDFFELIGVVLTSVYTYRYITDPAVRANAKKAVNSFVRAVTSSAPSPEKEVETPTPEPVRSAASRLPGEDEEGNF